MNKINISASDAQTATSEQINALAWNILNRKGDVDMSSCNVTVTPPSDMNAGMAGIIVKCAEESGGTVNISGATEIDDDTWAAIKEYGCPQWILNLNSLYGLDIGNLIIAYNNHKEISNAFNEKKLSYVLAPASTYIDTLYNIKGSDKVTVVFKMISKSTYSGIYGYKGVDGGTVYQCSTRFNYNGSNDNSYTPSTDTKYTVICDRGKWYVNGSNVLTQKQASFTSGETAYLNMVRDWSGGGDTQYYAFIVQDEDDKVVRYMVPIEGGMYDLVNNEEYLNSEWTIGYDE